MQINPSTLTSVDRKSIIEESFKNATKKQGEISFLEEVRTKKNDMSGKYSVKLGRIMKLFNSRVWIQHDLRSGHLKFTHVITNTVVEFSSHSNDVDPGAVCTIFNQLQHHINMLGNEILMFRSNNWKSLPDLKRASENWEFVYNSNS